MPKSRPISVSTSRARRAGKMLTSSRVTTDPSAHIKDVHPQDDGSYLVDGSASLRTLNRRLNWRFPTDGPKTLNGLILEYLESIPEPGTSMLLAGHPVEIIQVKDNAVKTARVSPPLRKEPPGHDEQRH